jgi:uncharacterized membrane protein
MVVYDISDNINCKFQWNYALTVHVINRKAAKNKLTFSLLASFLLANYDMISEPTMVLYGHQIWSYCINNNSTSTNYVVKPDWKFLPNQIGMKYYYGIPIQNFIGWLMVGFIIILSNIYAIEKNYIKENVLNKTFRNYYINIIRFLPIVVSPYCTIFYFIIHPLYPMGVRIYGSLFLVFVSYLLSTGSNNNNSNNYNKEK